MIGGNPDVDIGTYLRLHQLHHYRVGRMPYRSENRLLKAGFLPATGYADKDPYTGEKVVSE